MSKGKHIVYLFISLVLLPGSMLFSATLSGKVTSNNGASIVSGARVKISNGDKVVGGAYSNSRGMYEVRNLGAGSYQLSVTCVGYKSISMSVKMESSDKVVDLSLDENATRTEDVVVTASRHQEKALDAPASVSVVNGNEIREHPTTSAAEQLRGTVGVDIVQKGVAQNEVAVRGFTNVFSGTVLMLTDYRMSGVPSLRANIPYFIPATTDDIERMEVVRGPGSALFGPNATQGVVNILTRSPFSSKGTTVTVGAGNQSFMTASMRHAGTVGDNFGYKISAQYLSANDWAADSNEIKEEASALASVRVSGDGDTNLIGKRIQKHERYSADLRLDYNFSEQTTLSLTSGLAQAVSAIEMTDLGAGQAKDWRYTYANAQLNSGDLFAQLTYNKSDAGSTYLLRTGNPIVDRSSLIVAKVQHASSISELWNLTYGADVFLTNPETGGTINGKNEDDDNITEYGAYLQSNYTISKNQLNFLLTLRFDKHNRLEDPFISPRAALLYKLDENNAFRLTFNRAFQTPSTNDLFLDLEAKKNILVNPLTGQPLVPGVKMGVRALGAGSTGFTFERDPNGKPYYYSPQAGGAKFSTGDASTLFGIAKALVIGGIQANTALDSNTKKLLAGVLQGAPTPQSIALAMAILNPTTGTFSPVSGVTDISRLRPTVNQTFELGYTGNLNSSLAASVDVYYSKIKDFIGSQQVLSPNVFLVTQNLDQYYKPILVNAISGQLQAAGYPKQVADSIANVNGGIAAAQIKGAFDQVGQMPMGTVNPTQQTTDPTAITLGPRNYGDVSMIGVDVSLEYRLNRMLSLRGNASITNIMGDSAHANNNIYKNLDGISDLALNSPQYKGALGAIYRSDEGFTVGAQARWNGGFEMNSGVYIGQVNPYWMVDLNASYKLSFLQGMTVFVSCDNLLDHRISQFIGAAPVGRLISGRLSYTF